HVTNTADGDLHLSSVLTALPVGAHATELLDLTGRWCKERTPQRHPWVQGTHRRDARHGRTGHDATLLMVAGTPGFTFGGGEVWAVHTAWSGSHTTYAERTPEGDCLLGGGELLAPGEVVLARGETYRSPDLLGSWSPAGLDPLSHRFHAHLRAVTPRARGERPVIANTWEAVYFDQSLERLTELADVAASVGVERFVLDDGWFLGRRDDTAGLGDWSVDPDVWPEGLTPLVDHVRGRGMQFGLWVEPEMVNLDSETARDHPERVLRGRATPPMEWRQQQVLDLQDEGARADLRDALLALLDGLDIAYLKWDHNRDLSDATHDGRPAVHGQTLAAYALLEELREAHPALEIESCASGGARVDAEVLTRTDRIWPSDTNDPLERQHLQRWTSLLVPPELMGSHVGPATSHTTGRTHTLRYRAATALLHSFGIEWDMSRLDEAELAELRGWIELHKQVRPLIGSGTLVHPDHPDPAVVVSGIVAADASEAWYVVATVAATATQHPAPLRLTGLDPDRGYRLAEQAPPPSNAPDLSDAWSADGVELTGRVLATSGIALPVMDPEQARVLRLVSL
ncbi:MAG TPA: alpha-galactosidase, partial [Nocardioides sp.]